MPHKAYEHDDTFVHLLDINKPEARIYTRLPSRSKSSKGPPLQTSQGNDQSFPSEAAVVLCPAALARILSIWLDLLPRSPPPHTRRCSSYLSELSAKHISSSPHKEDNNKNSQVSLGSADKRSELPLIFTLHFLKSDNGSRLLVHDGSEAVLYPSR